MGVGGLLFKIPPGLAAALLFAAVLAGNGCQKPEDDQHIVPTTNGGAGGDTGGDDTGNGGAGGDGTGGDDDGGAVPGSGGSSGTGGSGTGGAVPDAGPDASIITDAPGTVDAVVVDAEMPLPPLAECNMPSIDRLVHWFVASEANAMTAPASGSILVPEADHQVGKVSFVGGGWHIVAVWTANSMTAQVDLGGSTGFTLTYSATADFYVQLREVANYASGAHYVAQIPSTGGQVQTVFVSFGADRWMPLARLGNPTVTFPQAITQVRGLFFIGDTANTLEFRRLRIDNYVPNCP
jgi:hypothetical protein